MVNIILVIYFRDHATGRTDTRSLPSEIITDAPPTTYIYTILHLFSVIRCKFINFFPINQENMQKVAKSYVAL